MSQASNHDRHYDVLGLQRGALLQEIEDAWRLRSAAFHPDKFPAESKEWATGRTQEINNARDELRRYWRERRRDAEQTEHHLHVRRAPPRPEPEPAPVEPEIVDFEPAAAAGSPETPAAVDQTLAPGLWRGAVLAYSLTALFVFVALLGASAALLRDPGGSANARAPQIPEPPSRIAMSRSEPAAAPSGERPAVTGPANGNAQAADPIVATKASEEPQPAAAAVPEPREAPAAPLHNAEPAPEAKEPPASAPPQSDAGIRFPPMPPEPSAQPARPVPPLQGRAKPRAQPSPVETSPVPSAAPASNQAVQQGPSAAGRNTLVAAARQACRSDLQRFCAGVQPGGGRIAQCARENFRQLSDGCSQALLGVRSAQQDRARPAGRY